MYIYITNVAIEMVKRQVLTDEELEKMRHYKPQRSFGMTNEESDKLDILFNLFYDTNIPLADIYIHMSTKDPYKIVGYDALGYDAVKEEFYIITSAVSVEKLIDNLYNILNSIIKE